MTDRPASPATALEPGDLLGSRIATAGRELVSSLVLLQGAAGLGPSK